MKFNKDNFSNLNAYLRTYAGNVISIIKDCIVSEDLRKMYSAEHFEKVKRDGIITGRRLINEKRKEVRSKVDGVLSKMRSEINDWINEPVDPDLLGRLQAIKVSGLKLSQEELTALANASKGQYLPLRILSEIAHDSELTLQAPNIEQYNRDIHDIEQSVELFLENYAGKNLEGISILKYDPVRESDNAAFASAYGFVPNSTDTMLSVMANTVLNEGNAVDMACERWSNNLIHVEKKEELTEQEAEQLSELYKGHESNPAGRTRDIVTIRPEYRDIIQLSEYAQFLPPKSE